MKQLNVKDFPVYVISVEHTNARLMYHIYKGGNIMIGKLYAFDTT